MRTFTTIKKKIKKYQSTIDDLYNEINKETNNLINEIYTYFAETKFLVAKKNGMSAYFYLSIIDTSDKNYFNGISIDEKNEIFIGKISINKILLMDEYESIKSERFFKKLRSIGVDLLQYNSTIAEECNRFKPTKIEPYDGDDKIVGYCRLSNGSQSKNGYDRQISVINKFLLNKGGYSTPEFFTETIKGTTKLKERKAINELIEFCSFNNITDIAISELNRIGRTKNVIMDGITFLMKNGIKNIYLVKENIIINEEYIIEHYRNLVSMAKSCEDEYNNIIYRMRGGYYAFVEKHKNGETNKKLGRQDYKKPEISYATDYEKEINLLHAGTFSMRQIRAITGTSLGTLQKLKKMFPKINISTEIN